MTKVKTVFAAFATAATLIVAPAFGQEAEADSHAQPQIEAQSWSFAGPFGKYDEHQLQRGFQVFREVCSGCHSARLIAFRNLSEEGGPGFTEEQVKALAAEYQVTDPSVAEGQRPGVAADYWPSPFASEQEARDANGGAVPPDFSVLAKARGTTQPGLWWVLNYFTAFQEGGPDYIHALLNGYEEPPQGTEVPEGKYYNNFFPGHSIGMAPPLSDGAVTYEVAEGEQAVPLTLDQYSKDVAAFMMWAAEPHLNSRKAAGFRVILFLLVFAGLMWMTKSKLWSRVKH